MQKIKYLISNKRFEELKNAVGHKGITLEEAYREIAAPYLEHCRSMKNERENGPDPKLVKRMRRESKIAYKKEMKDRKKEFLDKPNNIIHNISAMMLH